MLLLSANILEPKSLIRLLLFNFNNISEVFMVTLENFFLIFLLIFPLIFFVHFTKFTIEFIHWNILFCIEGVLLSLFVILVNFNERPV